MKIVDLSEIMDKINSQEGTDYSPHINQYIFSRDLNKLILAADGNGIKDIVCIYDLDTKKIIKNFCYPSISKIIESHNKIYFRYIEGLRSYWMIIDLNTLGERSFDNGEWYNLNHGQYIFLDDDIFLNISNGGEYYCGSFDQKGRIIYRMIEGSVEIHRKIIKDNSVAMIYNINDVKYIGIFRFNSQYPEKIFTKAIEGDVNVIDFSETHVAIFSGKLRVYEFGYDEYFESKHVNNIMDMKIIDKNNILLWYSGGKDDPYWVSILHYPSDVIKCREERYTITSIGTIMALK